MNKEKWGIKRVCLFCGTRFYDLNKSPILCPICGKEFDPEYLLKKKSKIEQDKDLVDDIDDVSLLDSNEDEDDNDDIHAASSVNMDDSED